MGGRVADMSKGEGRLERGATVWSGRVVSRAHTSSHAAVHAHAVVLLVLKGESSVRHRGRLHLRAGDVHLIPPGDPHRVDASDVEAWAVGFEPGLLGEGEAARQWLGPLLRVRDGCHPVLRPTAVQRRRLLRWMRLLGEETARVAAPLPGSGEATRAHERAVTALLQLVLVEVERMASPLPLPEAGAGEVARRALTYIEGHCTEPISLTDVARAVGRSAAHVAASVRAHTGRSVGAWILECRMAEARRRLLSTGERVDVVAERVGYRDVTHFIRLFRREHGATPAAWRRTAQRDHAAERGDERGATTPARGAARRSARRS